MKLPYNPNYELMKLPYSSTVFPSDLTLNPSIPSSWFEFHEEEIFMLWPSSWQYPDGLLRDAFGTLACLPDQPYNTLIAVPIGLRLQMHTVYFKKDYKFDRQTIQVDDLSDKAQEHFKTSWPIPYSINEYYIQKDVMRVTYYERNDALSKISQGAEIFCLKPEAFDRIQEMEYPFETRILEKFQYLLALRSNYIRIDTTALRFNVEENDYRTLEVEEKEEKRVTPMRPRW